MILKRFIFAVILLGTMAFISCVDDLDFDQTQDIELFPTAEVDLIFFSLVTENFSDVDIADVAQSERDTTRVEFLDDSFLRENVTSVELTFQVDNSFVQSFTNRMMFLDSNLNVMYALEFDITPSQTGESVRSVLVDNVFGVELEALLSSDRIVNEVILQPNDQPIVGELDFKSKGVFQLRVTDL